MNKQETIPLIKKDNLGRIIYRKWNKDQRSIVRYWGNTKDIKIIYKFLGDIVRIDAYNQKGKNIISYIPGKFSVNLSRLKIDNNKFHFIVKKEILKDWMKKK